MCTSSSWVRQPVWHYLFFLSILTVSETLVLGSQSSARTVVVPAPTSHSYLQDRFRETPRSVRELQPKDILPGLSSRTSKASSSLASAAVHSEIPLWDQCGFGPDEVCANGARCICKDQWWSQCRLPINGSWAPIDESWQCTEPAANSSVSISQLSLAVTSNPSPSSIQTFVTSIIRSGSSKDSMPSSVVDGTITSSSGISQQSIVKSFNITDASQPSSTLTMPSLLPAPSSTFFKTQSSLIHSVSAIATTKLNASSVYVSPKGNSSSPMVHASAYANPLVLSVLALLPNSLSSTSAHGPTGGATTTSVSVADGLPQPSSTLMLPNLACPSPSATKDGSDSQMSHSLAVQACDNNMPATPSNLSSTINSSSTPDIAQYTNVDPDTEGTYLDSNATADQQTHCLNIAAHQYQICWQVLNVTGYIQDWVSFNRQKCDSADMGFADCFLYLEVGAGANCTSFTGRSQCPSPDTRTFVNRKNGAQVYYVAFNIWNIQNWFFTYYMAVGTANTLATDSVATIARTLNLPLPKEFPILDILAGLAWSFGLLSPSGYAAALPYLGEKVAGFAAQAPGEYLLRAIQNAPTLSRNLIDAGDLGNSDVQIAELSSGLARIVSQLETNIQNSLVLVMSNFSLFYNFVQDGFFSTQIENLNTIAQNVTLSLNTYVVSQALQNDDVIITRALNTDINELQLNGSAVGYDTGCGHGYDEWGMCGNWWYDSRNRISYGLESKKDMLNNYTDALESLFNQGITTPQLLFMNSQFCADAAGSTQGNAPGTSLSTSTGVWNTECISNMKICTWDVVNLGVFNEYTDCDRESAFAMEECGDGEGIVQVTVPASYIGPYLTSLQFEGIVCNKWGKGMGNPG